MKTLRVNFVDFWPNFFKTDNYFYNLLSIQYHVIIDEVNPDILFFSVNYNNARERFNYKDCLRVFYTGENVVPNWDECDVAYTFQHSTDSREYRLPLWVLHLNWFNRPYVEERDQAYLHNIYDFIKPADNILLRKNGFCCFIASQPKGKRMEFVPKLSNTYKRVDCCGRLFNNMGGIVRGRGDQHHKIDWLKNYRFTIAMENTSSPGYCTEKIIHPMFAGSIPIYWGSTTVAEDFNPECFINCHDFASDEDVIERIKELDDTEHFKLLRAPKFKDNKVPDFIQPENVLAHLEKFLK